MASSEAKTKPGSEATKTLGSVSKRSCSHEEKSTKSPVSKLRHDGMRHANRTTVKALQSHLVTSMPGTASQPYILKLINVNLKIYFPVDLDNGDALKKLFTAS